MQLGHNCLNVRALLLIACGWSLAGSTYSAQWDGNVGFSPGLVYTDNVCQSKDNPTSDFTGIATMTPYGTVSAQGSKSSFVGSGSVSVNTLTDGDLADDGCSGNALEDRQKYFPNISSTFNTSFSDSMKLSATGRANQNEVNSALPSSNDNLDRNGNTNTFYLYSVSPSMSRRLAGSSNYNLRYNWSEVINTADEVSDSWRHAVNTGLSGSVGPRVTWNLAGNYSLTGYSDDVVNILTGVASPREDTELKSASFGPNYQISRRWQVNGRYGWEWNDFQTVNNANTGGSAWDVGVAWTPSLRTKVTVGSGDRFFGQTPRVGINHQGKRNTIGINYDKRITFQRDLNTGDLGSLDNFGSDNFGSDGFGGSSGVDGFDSGTDSLDGFGTDTSIYSNSAILDERATLRYSYAGRPGVMTFFGSYSQQIRAEDGAQADFSEWEISFRPQLSNKYSLIGSVAWQEIVPAGFITVPDATDFDEAQSWNYILQYNRPLNTRLSLSLQYRFIDYQSDDSFNEYKENLITATLNVSL